MKLFRLFNLVIFMFSLATGVQAQEKSSVFADFPLTLINADTEEDITDILPNDVLDTTVIKTSNLNVRANIVEGFTGSIRFELSGAKTFKRTESFAPYALFGDKAGDFFPGKLPWGKYTLKVTVYEAKRAKGAILETRTYNFQFVEALVITEILLTEISQDPTTGEITNEVKGDVLAHPFYHYDRSSGSSPVLRFKTSIGDLEGIGGVTWAWTSPDDNDGAWGVIKDLKNGAVWFEDYFYTTITAAIVIGEDIDERDVRDIRKGNQTDVRYSRIVEASFKLFATSDSLAGKAYAITDLGLNRRLDISLPILSIDNRETSWDIEYIPIKNNPYIGNTESVEFIVDGDINLRIIDNEPPFLVFGEDSDSPSKAGDYRIRCVPYSQKNAQGNAGPATYKRVFALEEFSDPLDRYWTYRYIDAEKDQILSRQEVSFGREIPSDLLIDFELINEQGGTAASTRIILMNEEDLSIVHEQIENKAPFALFGNNGQDFNGRFLEPGSYVLYAIAYEQKRAQGPASWVPQFFLNVLSPPANESVVSSSDISIYPNQSNGLIQVQPNQKVESVASIQIYNQFGQLMMEQNLKPNESQLDLSQLKEGIYNLIYTQGNQRIHKRIAIQK